MMLKTPIWLYLVIGLHLSHGPWCDITPAELLMGQLHTNLPQLEGHFRPDWTYLERFQKCNEEYKSKQKLNYDRRHRASALPSIPDETDVWITNGKQQQPGQVVRPADTPRSYIVDTPNGQVRRNRLHLNSQPDNSTRSRTDEDQPNSTPPCSPIMTRSHTNTTIRPPDRFF